MNHEAVILCPLSHPNIVKLHGVVILSTNVGRFGPLTALALVLEFMEGGCLEDRLGLESAPTGTASRQMSPLACARLSSQLSSALAYLHFDVSIARTPASMRRCSNSALSAGLCFCRRLRRAASYTAT